MIEKLSTSNIFDITISHFDITITYYRKIQSYPYDKKFKPDVAVKVDLLALSDSNNRNRMNVHKFCLSTNSGKFDFYS